MTRGILIAGNESSLFSAAAAEAVKRVASFASAQIPNRFPLPDKESVPSSKTAIMAGAIPLSWNPVSPISARTLILAAENRLKQINDAVLICSPPAVFKTAEALTPQEIDILVSDHIKGWFFLIRELIQYFRRTVPQTSGSAEPSAEVPGKCSLSFVIPEISAPNGAKNTPADLLGPSAAASFRAFAQAILASSAQEPFQIMGFTSAETGAETDFAAWFFKILDEGARKNSGRWHKYSKLGFFR